MCLHCPSTGICQNPLDKSILDRYRSLSNFVSISSMFLIGYVSNFVTQFSLLKATHNLMSGPSNALKALVHCMPMLMAQLCQPSASYSPLHLYFSVQHMELGTVSPEQVYLLLSQYDAQQNG